MSGKRSGRSRSAPPTGMAGVTLIELLVTLSIAVIVMTVAVPGFSSLIAETRRVTAVNELVGALNMARSEAIKSGARVTVCPSLAPNALAPACDTRTAWGKGWLIFQDNTHVAGNRLGLIDGTDRVLRTVAPGHGLNINTGSHYARGLFYDPSGVIWGISASRNRTVGNDTFTITADDVRVCLTINKSGRVSLRRPGQNACRG